MATLSEVKEQAKAQIGKANGHVRIALSGDREFVKAPSRFVCLPKAAEKSMRIFGNNFNDHIDEYKNLINKKDYDEDKAAVLLNEAVKDFEAFNKQWAKWKNSDEYAMRLRRMVYELTDLLTKEI